MTALNNQITLTDGRTLGFAEYGDPKGWPVMYFHGWPSSRSNQVANWWIGPQM
jgi:pimeloyl-ACP methyl ester carboxylesterase